MNYDTIMKDEILAQIFEQSFSQSSQNSSPNISSTSELSVDDLSSEELLRTSVLPAVTEDSAATGCFAGTACFVKATGCFDEEASWVKTDDDEEENEEDVVVREKELVIAKPDLYSNKSTGKKCGGFVLKEDEITALPLDPDEIFEIEASDGRVEVVPDWLLFLYSAQDEAICVLDYNKAIKALRNLAELGKKYIIEEKAGHIITTPLTKDEMKALNAEVCRLEEEEKETYDTGMSPDPSKAEGRMMYWCENWGLLFMAWLLVLSVRCPSMYDFGGFPSVIKAGAFSALFMLSSCAVSIGFLFGLAWLLRKLNKNALIIKKICIVLAHVAIVAFALRMVSDIYFIHALNDFFASGLVAKSSVSLGILLGTITVYKRAKKYC